MKFVLVVSLLGLLFASSNSKAQVMHGNKASAKPYTPAKGSIERKQIMDALRAEVKRRSNLDVIFVVKSLRVQNGWAWAETNPTSTDGKTPYEPISALLYCKFGIWMVQDVREYGDGDDDRTYFRKLKSKFSAMPAGILPGQ